MAAKNNVNGRPRILIVGGVAGGASCAARARRLSEKAEIIIFERGPHVSYASCGLPYYVGDIIKSERDLLVATPELFKKRLNIQVRLRHEVLEINREKQEITVKDLDAGTVVREPYDALVLSPGSSPIRPPIPGIDLPGIFMLRSIKDSMLIKNWINDKKVRRAVIIGGGFIGVETAENLWRLGMAVTILEMLPQIMPPLDPEMAFRMQENLETHKIRVHLNDGVAKIERRTSGNALTITTRSGAEYECEMVLLAAGVRPETTLAVKAGLEIGSLGGIRVDDHLRTSDPHIWAVGDAIETRNFITHEYGILPLAGPASRQGRIAAAVIMGREARFRGVQGTSVCKAFNLTAAVTGVTEKALNGLKQKIPFEKVYLHPPSHAGYYPDSKTINMKLIFDPIDGRILGAQAVGEEGVERRIDVISMAIQKGGTVFDLEAAEMCYAPQFGSPKDPVNMAGMVAANFMRGDAPVTHWNAISDPQFLVLDVREPVEYAAGHVEGAINIPLPSLRSRLNEIPRDKEIRVYCAAGQRSYYATRILKQNGFSVRNISGGMLTYKAQKYQKE